MSQSQEKWLIVRNVDTKTPSIFVGSEDEMLRELRSLHSDFNDTGFTVFLLPDPRKYSFVTTLVRGDK